MRSNTIPEPRITDDRREPPECPDYAAWSEHHGEQAQAELVSRFIDARPDHVHELVCGVLTGYPKLHCGAMAAEFQTWFADEWNAGRVEGSEE